MDKCREEFEKQKYWIGLFRDAVDFDEGLGRYVLNGQRTLYAFHLDSFNEKWAIWQEAWQHQQAKVEELQTLYIQQGINMLKLQKWVDAVKGLAQTLWEKSNEKHKQGKVWESKALGECADEILDVLEQALKGDQYDEHRKKAEEAISKGASLTNHRIEL